MPLYEFRNTKTGEQFTDLMSFAERETYLKENPEIESMMSASAVCDPVRMGIRRPDNGFKEVLSKIHERTPGSRLNSISKI